MTERAALEAAAALLAPYVGARVGDTLRRRLARALEQVAAARGLREAQVVALATSDPELLRELIDLTVVPETSFFRDAVHFDVLVGRLLAELNGPVRVWSAACASGQEPYSIAMALEEACVPDYRIVATDVSAAAVERVREASYSEREMRGLSAERRDRFLRRVEGRWEIVPALRDRVDVARSNLIEDDPPFARGLCHVVFCRNVTIYLDAAQAVRAIGRIAHWLAPGGHLFLGTSESLAHVDLPLELVEMDSAFVYRKAIRAPLSTPVERPRTAGGPPARAAAEHNAAPAPDQSDAPAMPAADELLARGDEAARAGDWRTAVRLFRQAVYVAPDEPVPHALLGLALEGDGDERAARRAFGAASVALEHAALRPDGAVLGLEGFDAGALGRLLADKLGPPA